MKSRSGIDRTRGSKTNTPKKVKIEFYIDEIKEGRTPTPAKIITREIDVYNKMPEGWIKFPLEYTQTPGYIFITNRMSLRAPNKKIGYITIETARKAKIITQAEYDFSKERQLKNEKHIKEFRGE